MTKNDIKNFGYYPNLGIRVRPCPTDLEIVVDPGILDPSNKIGLAETFWAYSCYFVVNPVNVGNHPIFSEIFIFIAEIFLAETKWID